MRRALKLMVFVAVLLVVTALGLVFTVLRTEVGAGWVLGLAQDRLAGFSYRHHEGSLAGGLVLERPVYAQDGLGIEAEHLRLQVAPAFFPLVLHLENVEMAGLEVRLPAPSEDTAGTEPPVSLALPLEIILEGAVTEGVTVLDSDQVELFRADRFELKARFHHQAEIEHAELVLPAGKVAARGEFGLERPFVARLDADTLYRLPLEGLNEPLMLVAEGLLTGSLGAYELAVDGSAEIGSFEMTAIGSVDLETSVVVGEVSWDDFAWPLIGSRGDALRSDKGSADVSGTLDDWRLDGRATVEAPGVTAGEVRFIAVGDRDHLEAEIPRAELLGGEVSGTVFFDWAAGGEFRASLLTNAVSTRPFYADWPAVVSGGLDVSGRIEPLALSFNARALNALVDGHTVTMDGGGAYENGALSFTGLDLRSARSLVSLDGSLQHDDGIRFEADIADLGRFIPGASGAVSGTGRFARRDDLPQVNLELSGSGLAWNDWGADHVRLASSPRAGPDGLTDVVIESEQARLGATRLDALSLQASLGRSQQDLVITAEKSGYRIEAGGEGAILNPTAEWPAWNWAGQLTAFSLAGGPDEQLIELEDQARLVLTKTSVVLEDACLAVTARARACLDAGWSEAAGVAGKAVFDQVPLRLLDPYLEAVELTQAVDGEVEFEIPPSAEASARAQFTFSPGTVRYSDEDVSILETGQGLLSVRMKRGEITRGLISLPIVGQGEIGVEFEVGDISEGLEAGLAGKVTANMDGLDVLSIFMPLVDEIDGRLRANLDLSGTLERPYFKGRIDLEDGLLRHAASGLALSDIQLSGEVAGDGKAALSGRFRAVEGEGDLAALIDFTNPLSPELELDVNGQGLKIFDAKDLVMTVDPDVRLEWRDGALHLDGQLAVPAALIAPSVIPSPAVVESPDVEIVAGSLPETSVTPVKRQKIPVYGSLELILGKNVAVDLSVADVDVAGTTRFEWNGPLMPLAKGSFGMEGEVLAFGQRLEITEGNIGFPDVPADNPHLNIQAERPIYGNSEIRRAGLLVTGTLRRMVIEPYTDPMTTRERAQTLLVTGSDFNMERGVGAVSIGTYIAPKIFLSYGVGVFGAENVVSVRYDLGSGWGMQATSGDSQTGVDISYTVEQ